MKSLFFLSAFLFLQITVCKAQSYFLRFPDDIRSQNSCPLNTVLGEPMLYNPDSLPLIVEYNDYFPTIAPAYCWMFYRSWTVYNAATYNPLLPCAYIPNPNPSALENHPTNLPGVVVSSIAQPGLAWSASVVKINPQNPTPTNYSQYWSSTANCYTYEQSIYISDGEAPVLLSCATAPVAYTDSTGNDPELWNAPYWTDPNQTGNDLREAPVDLSVQAYDSCAGVDLTIQFVLFLDLDQDGKPETAVYSQQPPAPGTVEYNNSSAGIPVKGILQDFDFRSVPTSSKYKFAIQTFKLNNRLTAALRWNSDAEPNSYVLPQLPPGNHSIRWTIIDNCGNETVCTSPFEIKAKQSVGVSAPSGKSGLVVHPAPNPFVDRLYLDVAFPDAAQAQLRIYSASGQSVFEQTAAYTAGLHRITVNKQDLKNHFGLLYYVLQVEGQTVTGKIIALEK